MLTVSVSTSKGPVQATVDHVAAGKPTHVIITLGQGVLSTYANGQPGKATPAECDLATWTAGPVLFASGGWISVPEGAASNIWKS